MFEPGADWIAQLPPIPAIRRLESAPADLLEGLSTEDQIALGWSLLVSDREEQLWERGRLVPGLRWCAVGLLHPELDQGIDHVVLGAILYADTVDGTGSFDQLESLRVDEWSVPVRVRRGTLQDHAPQPLPGGRLACWATTRGGALEGWLTARHVATSPPNAGAAVLVDQAPECLDAAIVRIGQRGLGAPKPAVLPIPGSNVHLDLGAPIAARVLDVATNLGVARSSRFPLRFSINAAGVRGDSGGLITSGSDPVGLYLAAFTPAGGAQRAGVGLAISQLEHFMTMEVHL